MARESWVYRDGKLIPKHLAPPHPLRGGMQIIRDIEPYKNMAVDGGVIGGRRQHRDMLRAHRLVEVGDQAPRTPMARPADKVDMGLAQTIKRAMGKW